MSEEALLVARLRELTAEFEASLAKRTGKDVPLTAARSPRIGPVPGKTPRQDSMEFERPDLYPHPPVAREDMLDASDFSIDSLRRTEFEGIFNLSLLMLFFAITYNVVRSIAEHGVRFRWDAPLCPAFREDLAFGAKFAGILLVYSVLFFVLVKAHVAKWIEDRALWGTYAAAQVLLLSYPAKVILYGNLSPLIGTSLCILILIHSLKCHSYVLTNEHLFRQHKARLSRHKTSVKGSDSESDDGHSAVRIRGKHAFPSNVTLANFLNFLLLVPLLAYEPSYPRNKRIRYHYIGKKLAQMIGLGVFIYLDFMQFMVPVLMRSDVPFMYAVLKLTIPSFMAWLAGFYAGFNCWLNILAEIGMFADRRFYLDWWNTTSIESFWRKWNLPVHEWALRHVVVDMTHYFHTSRTAAMFFTFFVSAIFHEFIFFIALNGTINFPWFFVGMLFQVPLIFISRDFIGHRRGNLIMWFGLFSGQPLLEVLYFREWFKTNSDIFCTR